ncbi:MAG: helix-turn-helix domain-containing protein [Lachnospiraceae bacterium]
MNLFDEKFMKTIGTNLKYYRKLFGLSQEELAFRCNLSTSFYKTIEAMKAKNPGIRTIARICHELNIPLDYLTKDTGYRLFEHYRNVHMFEEMSKLPDEEFKIFTDALTLQYKIFKDREKFLKKDEDIQEYTEPD